jgi:hypothetical protein
MGNWLNKKPSGRAGQGCNLAHAHHDFDLKPNILAATAGDITENF